MRPRGYSEDVSGVGVSRYEQSGTHEPVLNRSFSYGTRPLYRSRSIEELLEKYAPSSLTPERSQLEEQLTQHESQSLAQKAALSESPRTLPYPDRSDQTYDGCSENLPHAQGPLSYGTYLSNTQPTSTHAQSNLTLSAKSSVDNHVMPAEPTIRRHSNDSYNVSQSPRLSPRGTITTKAIESQHDQGTPTINTNNRDGTSRVPVYVKSNSAGDLGSRALMDSHQKAQNYVSAHFSKLALGSLDTGKEHLEQFSSIDSDSRSVRHLLGLSSYDSQSTEVPSEAGYYEYGEVLPELSENVTRQQQSLSFLRHHSYHQLHKEHESQPREGVKSSAASELYHVAHTSYSPGAQFHHLSHAGVPHGAVNLRPDGGSTLSSEASRKSSSADSAIDLRPPISDEDCCESPLLGIRSPSSYFTIPGSATTTIASSECQQSNVCYYSSTTTATNRDSVTIVRCGSKDQSSKGSSDTETSEVASTDSTERPRSPRMLFSKIQTPSFTRLIQPPSVVISDHSHEIPLGSNTQLELPTSPTLSIPEGVDTLFIEKRMLERKSSNSSINSDRSDSTRSICSMFSDSSYSVDDEDYDYSASSDSTIKLPTSVSP